MSSDEGVEEAAPIQHTRSSRRKGVSAEAMAAAGADNWVAPVFEKTAEERQQLSNIIRTSKDSKLHMLFGNVDKPTFEKIVDAMSLKKVSRGEKVIEQGDVGDFFYIVKNGLFDIVIQRGNDPPKKVFEASVGFAFGELALLYNAPRSATIVASNDAEVWCLDRMAFRNLVVRSAESHFKLLIEFINNIDIFQVLDAAERAAIAEVFEEEEFEDDEAIVEQGERDDKMFILRTGKAVACIKGEQGEVEVMNYENGNYFGEIALLSGQPRKASVYAVGTCTCLYITRSTFLRVLGPLQNLLERNIEKYDKYSDAIAGAALEEEEPDGARRPSLDVALDLTQAGQAKRKLVTRKRERNSENLQGLVDTKKGGKEMEAEGEPASLKDKVAQDFQNPALVNVCDDFIVPDSKMMIFGGLKLGQKFTQDKRIHCRTGLKSVQSGEEDVWSWEGPTKLKGRISTAVLCQKGQKSAFDPTPNQDNFFVHHIGAVSVYGVCDGHGPFGHLVSFRLVQTLPSFLAKSKHFGSNMELALKEAFLASHQDLVDFCKLHNINITASGAAGSVLVMEEQTVHIAYIGDARVMLGSWNRHDSRTIFTTTDHTPDLPQEKARLEAAGSEVREIDPGNWRIYIKGTQFPGLTMSRAFGDTACDGVLREPEYHKFLMQPSDQWYAVVASDGIWEFIQGEEACTMTSKKLRLKGPMETVQFLTGASRKRWAHCCGEYCDDITGVLIQWNAPPDKESAANHVLAVRRESPSE